ncbi:4'-phosphopantetheinyl transferase family protein [Methylopila musalis]|uniref:4'-phosphopantetheinyl transferase family protein n=1 Tax=Methylopila musalis TaxID=1134781 RepID=A0ABW3Z2K8_9HYPH
MIPPHPDDLSAAALADDRIDLWLAVPSAPGSEDEADLHLLSDDERERWRRFVAPGARAQFLAARLLLRRTLSRYHAAPPEAWRFAAGAHGRPHVAEPVGAGLEFNLSHTDGLVALAVSREREVGVDVENVSRVLDTEALAPAVFAPPEAAAFAATAPADRLETFFALWTLKEAYAKARGLGLSLPLDSFAFDLAGAAPALHVTDRCPDDPARWRFWRLRPTPSHALALAAPARMRPPRLIWSDERTAP